MVGERALDLLTVGVGVESEAISDVDPLDDQHVVFELDFADRLARQTSFCGGNLTRLQRASKGPRQSAGGGRNDVVEGRRALRVSTAWNPVVVGDLVVDAEVDRFGGSRHLSAPKRPSDALDVDARDVYDLRSSQRFQPPLSRRASWHVNLHRD